MALDSNNIAVGGAETNVNKKTAGYSTGGSLKTNIERDRFEAGTPSYLVKAIIKKIALSLDIQLDEIKHENLLLAMGLRDDIVTLTEAAEVTTYYLDIEVRQNSHAHALNKYLEPATPNGYLYKVTDIGSDPHQSGVAPPVYPTTIDQTVSDGDLTLTCKAYPSETVTREADGGNYKYKLAGYNYKAASPPRVYKSDYSELYEEGTDYFFDYVEGKVINDGTTLGTTVKVVHKWTPITSIKYRNAPDEFVFNSAFVEFIHTLKTTGKDIKFTLYDAQSNQFSLPMNEGRSTLKLTLDANQNINRVGRELASIFFEA